MRAPVLLALVSLAGCFGHESAPARFFVLSPTVRPEPSAAASAASDGALAVGPAQVPDYLDRPQIVTFRSANEIAIDEFRRWGEPTSSAVARVVASDLQALLPSWVVVVKPWDPTVPVRARLVLAVDELGWDQAGEARLEGTWTLLAGSSGSAAASGHVSLRRRAASASADAGAATSSELLGELARTIASHVRQLPPAAAR